MSRETGCVTPISPKIPHFFHWKNILNKMRMQRGSETKAAKTKNISQTFEFKSVLVDPSLSIKWDHYLLESNTKRLTYKVQKLCSRWKDFEYAELKKNGVSHSHPWNPTPIDLLMRINFLWTSTNEHHPITKHLFSFHKLHQSPGNHRELPPSPPPSDACASFFVTRVRMKNLIR